jgi:hypothetical protein
MRYEVWAYSKSWKKWIRNIYPTHEEAQKRYERLQNKGRRVKPPQPMNTGLPLLDRLKTFLAPLFKKKKHRRRRKETLS